MELRCVQTPRCPMCGQTTSLSVRVDQYNNWVNGALIQKAFPDMAPEDRELLITGMHSSCWNLAFSEGES